MTHKKDTGARCTLIGDSSAGRALIGHELDSTMLLSQYAKDTIKAVMVDAIVTAHANDDDILVPKAIEDMSKILQISFQREVKKVIMEMAKDTTILAKRQQEIEAVIGN